MDQIQDRTATVGFWVKLPRLVKLPLLAPSSFPEYAADIFLRNAMIPDFFRPFVQALYENRNYRFWACQVTGWGGYSLATFFSITLIDGDFDSPHLGHIFLSAVLGILTSWPLRVLYQRTFGLPIWRRLLVASVAVVVLSGVWNVARVWVFALFVDKPAIWDEFNYWYFGSLSIFLSWTVLYYGIKYYELLTLEHQKLLEVSALKRAEQLRRLQAESSARDAQLQMLRYQLNPHFLFNTLNSINALVKLKDNSKAEEMIQLLSQFLRHTLEEESVENVPLEQELESLALYLNIERTRFEDRLTLEFDIAPEALQAQVPALILQPIIENSMKYAIATSEDGGTVSVSAHVLGDELQLEVSDTGPGMGAKKSSQGRGIGLRNTRERLETLYKGKYSFETIERTPSGLTIQIRFPLRLAPLEDKESTAPEGLNQCAS
jgi:two-component system LytT family sensor kinase